MKVYVVNELSQRDSVYNICHGVFKNKKDAVKMAKNILKNTFQKLNIGGIADFYDIENDLSGYVCNDAYNYETTVEITEMNF